MTQTITSDESEIPKGTRVIVKEGQYAGRAGTVVSVSPNWSAVYNQRSYIAVCVDTGTSMIIPEGNIIKSYYQNEPLED